MGQMRLLPGLLTPTQCTSLDIGTPKIINFPFVPKGNLIVFSCPNIYGKHFITG